MMDAPPDLPQWLRWGVYVLQQIGFPAAVAGFVLYRLNGKISALTEAMLGVSAAFQSVKDALVAHGDWAKEAIENLRDEIRAGRRR